MGIYVRTKPAWNKGLKGYKHFKESEINKNIEICLDRIFRTFKNEKRI